MKRFIFVFLAVIGLSTPVYSQNIITVSAFGGDFIDPVGALDAIGTTLPAASAANRYVVSIAPGRYDVSSSINMQPFVDLAGSGVKSTLIRGAVSWVDGGDLVGVLGVINAASKSEIRHLTVQNTWSATSAIAIGVKDVQGVAITDVRAIAKGNADSSGSWKYGLRIVDSKNVRLSSVVARGKSSDPTACQGIAVRNSTVFVNDSRLIGATCSLGLGVSVDDGSKLTITNSLLRGEGDINGISVSAASDDAVAVETLVNVRNSVLAGEVLTHMLGAANTLKLHISHSELTGPVRGNPVCFSSHDPALLSLNANCLP